MIFDDLASQLKREYEVFLFALTGRYLSLSAAGVQVSPQSITAVQKAGITLQGMFLEHANALVRQFAQDYPSASAQARVTAFERELTRMSDINIKSLTDRMRGAAINPTAVGEVHGAMGLLLQQKMAEPEYRIPTKSGRSFDAKALLWTEARDFGYRIWLDNKLEWIAQGGDLAQVQYPDPNHADNGMVFSISGKTQGVPSYAEIKDKVFHYNAQAMIVPHVSL